MSAAISPPEPMRILRNPPAVARQLVPVGPARLDLPRLGAGPCWRQAGVFRLGGELVARGPARHRARERVMVLAGEIEGAHHGVRWWGLLLLLAGFGAAATHFFFFSMSGWED